MKRVLLLATLLLAGCGGRAPLEPAAGETLPVAAYGATQERSVDQLLARPPEARPRPAGELLQRSSEREGDRFDLPPPD